MPPTAIASRPVGAFNGTEVKLDALVQAGQPTSVSLSFQVFPLNIKVMGSFSH